MSTSKKRWLSLLCSLLIVVGAVSIVHAQGNGVDPNVLWGSNYSQSTFQNIVGLGDQDPRVTIAKIIRLLLGFLGIIAVVLILYAGFIWMTSGGNDEKISKAKAILKNAVIGLAIILASFGIVAFILKQLIGATGGNGNGSGGGGSGGGVSGLGNGIIKSVYPEPFQKDVPRNTTIVVTFREAMKAITLCDTVVVSGGVEFCAPSAKIRPGSVRIFKTSESSGPYVTDVAASSVDNKTFIFKPAGPAYLGDQNGKFNYTVNLTADVKKENGSRAFTSIDGFRWTFEVSNKLDLESPQILGANNGGIFPPPDDDADTVSGTTTPTPAQATITVSAIPASYRAPSAIISRLTPPSTPLKANVSGNNRCAAGTITIGLVDISGTLKARVSYTQPGLLPTDLTIISGRFDLTPCHLTVNLDPGYSLADSWKIITAPEVRADTVTVGSKLYTFVGGSPNDNQIAVGATNAATALSIRDSINRIHPEVTATASGIVVTFTAKVAGSAGNRLELSTNNQVALGVTAFSGGTDLTTRYTIKDQEDRPKNTVIQINFNESINPLTISGSSTDVADKLRVVNAGDSGITPLGDGGACTLDKECLSYKCSSGHCIGDQLAGTFLVSNRYKTAEFISDTKCGVNGCGENIYCLPGNSHLKVQIEAASLIPCASNSDCTQSPFNSCISNVCQDASSKNYPVANSLNGIVDAANNSLDGNRNDNPQGKVDVWNENLTSIDNAGRGDNYEWSFWISDRLDLTTPQITSSTISNNQSGVGISTAIEVLFSKLMLASSLSSGSITVNNGIGTINHHLINLWSMASDPIGYWINKDDKDLGPIDGRPDHTAAIINHGIFNDTTAYRTQVGSGVKDIYQNCYKPSAGPTCSPDSANPSCCRDSGGTLVPTSALNAQGNCP